MPHCKPHFSALHTLARLDMRAYRRHVGCEPRPSATARCCPVRERQGRAGTSTKLRDGSVQPPKDRRRRGRERTPKGLIKRGKRYIYRDQREGKRVWINLGDDYATALKRFSELSQGAAAFVGTVAQAADRWLAKYIRTRRAERDARMAQVRAERYLKPFLGTKQLTRITGDDLRDYRLWLQRPEAGISLQTVAHLLSDARCFFNWAVSEGLLDRSPFPRRLMPKIQ